MEWVVVHKARLVPGIQNGLAQVAGKPLPAIGRQVVRAVLLTGNATWQALPGDLVEHRSGPFTSDILGASTVIGCLSITAKGSVAQGIAVTVDGHEPEAQELEELAQGLGDPDTWALLRRLEALAAICGGDEIRAVVLCW